MMQQFTFMAFTLISGQDDTGVYGLILHYALVFAIVGSSLLAFLYFWGKGRLDMDEEPKRLMMQEEEENFHGR
jgi:hypothetical protein